MPGRRRGNISHSFAVKRSVVEVAPTKLFVYAAPTTRGVPGLRSASVVTSPLAADKKAMFPIADLACT